MNRQPNRSSKVAVLLLALAGMLLPASGCAFLAGAGVGGAAGYVAGREHEENHPDDEDPDR